MKNSAAEIEMMTKADKNGVSSHKDIERKVLSLIEDNKQLEGRIGSLKGKISRLEKAVDLLDEGRVVAALLEMKDDCSKTHKMFRSLLDRTMIVEQVAWFLMVTGRRDIAAKSTLLFSEPEAEWSKMAEWPIAKVAKYVQALPDPQFAQNAGHERRLTA